MTAQKVDIRELLSFRLTSLSQVSDANGQQWLVRDHGIRLLEWRVMGLIVSLEPAGFSAIAQNLRIDKGQLSRIISRLSEQGLVDARPDPADQRGRVLRLTRNGLTLYRRILPEAIQRNNDMVQHMTEEEIRTLFSLLDKLKTFTDKRASGRE